jgi:Secretion system C-terminal sorting domain
MKTIKIIFILVILGFNNIFAQIKTEIESVIVNSGVTLFNCNLIDLGSNSNNSLNFSFKLTKPVTQATGVGTLRVLLKFNSASPGVDKGSMQILGGLWTSPSVTGSIISSNISATEIQTTGSSVLIEYTTDSGVKTRSCEYPLKKSLPPSFTFAPTTVSLACGDTASRTFTVTPANIPPNSTVTYNWSAPGWTQISSTTNSRTFRPSLGSILPSAISVTPSINTVAQPTMTCTVTRAQFTSNAAISGASAICTIGASAIYTINAGSGSTVVWSGSNSSIATLSNATSSQVTVTRQAPGEFILNATITNQCNEVVNIPPRAISGGVPQFNSFTFGDEFLIPACFSVSCLTTGLQSAVINASFSGMSASEIGDDSNWEWVSNNNLIFLNSLANRTQVCPLQIGSSNFKVRAKNACGWSDWVDYQLFDITECPFNFRTSTIYTVFPNPSNDIVNIELKDSKIQPTGKTLITGELFDIMGQSRRKVEIKNNSASLSVAELKKGIYVLNINIDGKVEGHQVIVE